MNHISANFIVGGCIAVHFQLEPGKLLFLLALNDSPVLIIFEQRKIGEIIWIMIRYMTGISSLSEATVLWFFVQALPMVALSTFISCRKTKLS